jgi:hypothetical protein
MSIATTIESRVSRPVAFIALLAAAAMFVSVMVGVASQGLGYDLIPLAVAGRLAIDDHADRLYVQDPHAYNRVGDAIVRDESAKAGFSAEPTPFVYPPLVAFGMKALAGVRFTTIARTWTWLSALLLLAGLHLVSAAYAPAWTFWKRPLPWAVLLLLLCAFEPIRYGFWLGQTTAIIFPLVVAALLLQRRGRSAAAGIALALAAFVKLTPIVFLGIWIWRGPRRAAVWCIGVLVLLWAVSIASMGVDTHLAYIARVAAISRVDVAAYNNHSLLAFFSRPLVDPAAWSDWRMLTPPAVAVALNWIVLAAGLGCGAYLVARIPTTDEARWRPLAEAGAFLLILLAPNIAWTHYFVFLLPVLTVVLIEARGDSRVPVALAALAFVLCCRPILAAQEQIPATDSLRLMSTPTIAAFAAAVALFWTARHRSPA